MYHLESWNEWNQQWYNLYGDVPIKCSILFILNTVLYSIDISGFSFILIYLIVFSATFFIIIYTLDVVIFNTTTTTDKH